MIADKQAIGSGSNRGAIAAITIRIMILDIPLVIIVFPPLLSCNTQRLNDAEQGKHWKKDDTEFANPYANNSFELEAF